MEDTEWARSIRNRYRPKIKIANFNGNLDTDKETEVVETIRNKFNDYLKRYKYATNVNQLKKGLILKYVDLSLTRIGTGLIVNIKTNQNNNVYMITLMDLKNKTYWNILPKKYFLFYKKPSRDKGLKWILQQYFKTLDTNEKV